MAKLITILGLALVLITGVAAISSARASELSHHDFCHHYKQKAIGSGQPYRWEQGYRCPGSDW